MSSGPLHIVPNERALLQQIAAGDADAFRQLYDQYWNQVYTTALAYLKSPEWAGDIVQDIFLKLWQKRDKFSTVDNFAGWFFFLARNTILDALRKKLDSGAEPDPRYEDKLSVSPEQSVMLKEAMELIARAVENFPPQQKLIFKLSREEGLSHEEIAGRLGIDKRTVSNHLTKALSKLRHLLSQYPHLLEAISGIALVMAVLS